MNFDNTIKGFYQACTKRVDARRKQMKLPQIAVYRKDKSLVSHFFHCKTTKNNPYLITKEFINGKDEAGIPIGCIPILKFKNEIEVLWGTDNEIQRNLPVIFLNIMQDLLKCESKDVIDVNAVLYDYVPYAKYSTFYTIKHRDNISLLTNYGIYDETVSTFNMALYQHRAINYLYSKDDFRNSFESTFCQFVKETLTFTKIDKALENNYIKPIFIPLLEKELPSETSLGLRTKILIENDISKAKNLILQANKHHTEPSSELIKMLINASSTYIVKLEEIQKMEIRSKGSQLTWD